MKPLLDWLVYIVVRSFFVLLRIVPRSVAYFVCRVLADLFFLLDRKHRQIGMINLSIAFPDKDERWRHEVLRRSFEQQGDHAVELSRLDGLTSDVADRRFRYEEGRGIENYLAAREKGRGVLFVTAHVSAWEILPAAHALHGYPLSFVVRPLDNRFLDRWLEKLRSKFGNRVVQKNAAIRRSLKLLADRRDVGFLIDQNIQEREGVFVPLFGRPACTTSSVAALALRTGAPIVPGFICPDHERGCYRIRFYAPLTVTPSDDHQGDLLRYTAECNRYVEEVIREFPHCWLWGHRRFRTQPDGSNPYAVSASAEEHL